jgi:hypothetical protein
MAARRDGDGDDVREARDALLELGRRRLCNLAEPGATWHVAVTLTRQTPQTQKSAMHSVPAWQSLLQFAVYKT